MADTRTCSGSTTFGIEAHEAPVTDFPHQPSRKDGLGRMCKAHWNQYTSALRKAALARTAAAVEEARPPEVAEATPAARGRPRRAAKVAPATAVEAGPDAAPAGEG